MKLIRLMTDILQSRYLCVINFVLCETFGQKFLLVRPHNLALIHKQYQQLADAGHERRVAHISYMLNQLKPFAHLNRKTAVMVAILLLDEQGYETQLHIKRLSGLLKHEVQIDVLEKEFASYDRV